MEYLFCFLLETIVYVIPVILILCMYIQNISHTIVLSALYMTS